MVPGILPASLHPVPASSLEPGVKIISSQVLLGKFQSSDLPSTPPRQLSSNQEVSEAKVSSGFLEKQLGHVLYLSRMQPDSTYEKL